MKLRLLFNDGQGYERQIVEQVEKEYDMFLQSSDDQVDIRGILESAKDQAHEACVDWVWLKSIVAIEIDTDTKQARLLNAKEIS